MRVTLLPAAAIVALAPAGAFAVDYMSAEQAQKRMFPQADAFERLEPVLDADDMRRLNDAGLKPYPRRLPVHVAKQGGGTLGYFVVDEAVGKFERITYALGMNADGSVRQLEILSYRESHGHEIRLPAWRRQFEGKTAGSPLRVGDDIANISGATLSCAHVTDGVRRDVVWLDMLRRAGKLPS
ncbi:FMN-binding protein [Diaphorobacter ruginosibacter]|uniref:FMN-binding protein n=1 Tax=Diaphorobacter ruginosibacter TaxID=1715720 RepID=UPI00333F5B3D